VLAGGGLVWPWKGRPASANLVRMTGHPGARPPLDAARLRRDAPSVRPGGPAYNVEVVAATGSTNADVATRAREGAAEGLVVAAEHQQAGRGRLDRQWEAPDRAALTFSVLLRPGPEAPGWTWLPLLTGVAVASVVRDLGVAADLKWPNDVLVWDRKLAGLLVERIETGDGPAAVVGIGLNVSQTQDELPVAGATSLALEASDVDRNYLLERILVRLAEEYAGWLGSGGVAALRAAYVELCPTTRGRQVRVELPGGGSLEGEGAGLSADGGLLVWTSAGVQTVNAGDVIHVRPAG
jgi:BirA family transcriptional regulator, biotin operon repressor / biotin---[acetyl-CoA-carboxylase] ligase